MPRFSTSSRSKPGTTTLARRAFCEWLARVVRDGAAINANVAFSKASRAIIAEPTHAEALIALICETGACRGREQRAECLEFFQFARKRLEADPSPPRRRRLVGHRPSVSAKRRRKRCAAVLNVGADSTLLEDFAERYLFHPESERIHRPPAFREGQRVHLLQGQPGASARARSDSRRRKSRSRRSQSSSSRSFAKTSPTLKFIPIIRPARSFASRAKATIFPTTITRPSIRG